jgi:hypothetical protein
MKMIQTIVAATCLSAGAANAETINTEWNNVALQAFRDAKPSPPVSARALAILNTCIYDAWAAYDDTANGTQYGGDLRQPMGSRTEENKTRAISNAAYTALVDLFPSRKVDFDRKMNSLGLTPEKENLGTIACAAVLKFRHGDGSNQLNNYADTTGYTPVNTSTYLSDVNHWQPLPGQKFITPHWKNVTPFALSSATQFLPGPPAQYPSHEFTKQALDIMQIRENLTEKQKAIAEYWADGPKSELPPGHWILFSEYISERDNHSIEQDSKMYFAVSNALLDASIACWTVKVTYDSARPITVIRSLFDPTWKPYQPDSFLTPPFAEYSSGHSTFSAAAAKVLERFTKSNEFNHSAIHNGITLEWKTFKDAADEAGMSRRYGGIHFEKGDLVGRYMGEKVGEQAWRKAKTYF